jgi:hypothetical protein
MNSLNSVLVEGTVSGIDANGTTTCFTVTTSRYLKDDRVTIHLPIVIGTDGQLAQVMQKRLADGLGVRVVGHLEMIDNTMGIFAEHVEIRPGQKTKDMPEAQDDQI